MRPISHLLTAWACACAWVLAASSAGAQVQEFERDTTITGPRGRSIERQVEIQRAPGMIDRQVEIRRPGGTIERQVQIQRAPIGRRPGPVAWGRPMFAGPRPVFVQPAPVLGFGLVAAPLMSFSFGGGGMGFGGGGMGFGGGVAGPAAAPAPPPPPPDQVALMCERLKSFYSGSRKEAAYALGRLGDPRAVPSLIHVLKYDNFKDVRVAAAIALGEIGGSDAAVALERSSIYDHREDVRKASTTALERLNTKARTLAAPRRQPGQSMSPGVVRSRAAQAPEPQPPATATARPAPPPSTTPSPFREERQPAPTDSGPDLAPPADPGGLNPPPPPTPVTSGSPNPSNP